MEGDGIAGLRLDIALPRAIPISFRSFPHDPLTHQRCVAADLFPSRVHGLDPRHHAVPGPGVAAQGELVVAQPVQPPRADHRPRLPLSPSPCHRCKLIPAVDAGRRCQSFKSRLLFDDLLVAGDQVRLRGAIKKNRVIEILD